MNGERNAVRPKIYLLNDTLAFPPVCDATPEGLVAVGGDLSVPRLLLAYRSGLFPWYSEGDPILWFSPDPRMILFPDKLHVPRSLQRRIAAEEFEITLDRDFRSVIRGCQKAPRPGQAGTWITEDVCLAYERLHAAGHAHSAEVWQDRTLVGGLYGIRMGRCYFGESMFSTVRDASKVGYVYLVNKLRAEGVRFIDCQVYSEHLARLGAEPVPRTRFLQLLSDALRDK